MKKKHQQFALAVIFIALGIAIIGKTSLYIALGTVFMFLGNNLLQ